MEKAVPAADPVEHTDGRALTEGEEIAGGIFRSIVFPHLDREHIWVQSCLFAGCLFPACTLRGSHFTDVTFRNCDLSNADQKPIASGTNHRKNLLWELYSL